MSDAATVAVPEPIKAIQRRLAQGKPKVAKKPPRRPRLEEANPDLAGVVIETYAQTQSKYKTEALTGFCRETITRILERNPEALSEARKRLGNKALEVSGAFLDRALQTVVHAKGTSAAIGAKVLGQMALEQHDLIAPAVQVNIQVLNQSATLLSRLDQELAALKAVQTTTGCGLASNDQPITDTPQEV